MSHQAALDCAERLKTDQAFRDRVAGAGDDAARLEIINATGFAVTAEDRETIVAALSSADGELSEAQLEGISGGTSSNRCYGGNLGPGVGSSSPG